MNQLTDDKAPLFKPFAWVATKDRKDTGRYTMLSDIRDLACGVGLVMAMVERQQLDTERGDAPLIDEAEALQFTRMSIAAMSMIEGLIAAHFEDMNDSASLSRQLAAKKAGAA